MQQSVITYSRVHNVYPEIAKVIIGQNEAITCMLIGILCQGHILLEGVPGVAKTSMIKALARALGLTFKRIQFTPDLLPSDIIGTLIYNPKTQEFETKPGPIFANFILADEINRAPAKVQSALLEAMQEHQVTIGSETYFLEEPFTVFATQNPLEQEGTYRLPEAQIDRFMCKVLIDYPTSDQEKEIILSPRTLEHIQKILSREHLLEAQKFVSDIYCDEKIVDYIVSLIAATRNPGHYNIPIKQYISCGASPRATRALYQAAKAHAFLQQRLFVTPDDVKSVASPVLRHRITLTYEATADNVTADTIITKILSTLATP